MSSGTGRPVTSSRDRVDAVTEVSRGGAEHKAGENNDPCDLSISRDEAEFCAFPSRNPYLTSPEQIPLEFSK